MIDDHLDKCKLTEVFHLFYEKGVTDRDKIKKADEIIELVGHGDKEIFLFRNLEEEGNGEKEGKDDNAAQHYPLHIFQHLLIRIRRKIRIRIHHKLGHLSR